MKVSFKVPKAVALFGLDSRVDQKQLSAFILRPELVSNNVNVPLELQYTQDNSILRSVYATLAGKFLDSFMIKVHRVSSGKVVSSLEDLNAAYAGDESYGSDWEVSFQIENQVGGVNTPFGSLIFRHIEQTLAAPLNRAGIMLDLIDLKRVFPEAVLQRLSMGLVDLGSAWEDDSAAKAVELSESYSAILGEEAISPMYISYKDYPVAEHLLDAQEAANSLTRETESKITGFISQKDAEFFKMLQHPVADSILSGKSQLFELLALLWQSTGLRNLMSAKYESAAAPDPDVPGYDPGGGTLARLREGFGFEVEKTGRESDIQVAVLAEIFQGNPAYGELREGVPLFETSVQTYLPDPAGINSPAPNAVMADPRLSARVAGAGLVFNPQPSVLDAVTLPSFIAEWQKSEREKAPNMFKAFAAGFASPASGEQYPVYDPDMVVGQWCKGLASIQGFGLVGTAPKSKYGDVAFERHAVDSDDFAKGLFADSYTHSFISGHEMDVTFEATRASEDLLAGGLATPAGTAEKLWRSILERWSDEDYPLHGIPRKILPSVSSAGLLGVAASSAFRKAEAARDQAVSENEASVLSSEIVSFHTVVHKLRKAFLKAIWGF